MKSLLALASVALFAASLAPVADPVAELKSSKARLTFEPETGYLKSLLKELKIDPSSQILVWSKSSLQAEKIDRKNPRAIYFNSDTYVGFIPGASLIEVMSVHPTKGVIFYKILNTKGSAAKIEEEDLQCMRCHGGRSRGVVPQLFVESSFVSENSYPRPFSPTRRVRPNTALKERWGGWFVTGTHGAERHMGNSIATGSDEKPVINKEKGANLTDLRKLVDTRKYLTPHSDIVALLVAEKQMHVQNMISQASLDLQTFDRDDAESCEDVVRALLCVGEAKFKGPIKGTSSFADVYSKSAPTDSKGRSLSQLDLNSRILKFSCSPLIYSPTFDAIPERGRRIIGKRFAEILTGQDKSGNFDHLSELTKSTLLEILKETKPEFVIAPSRR